MDFEYIKDLIKEKYGLEAKEIEKIKNVYKIKTNLHIYCLKIVKYKLERFLFVLGAIKHLKNNNFDNIPALIRTIDGEDYIKFKDAYAYFTTWIDSRVSNYSNPIDVQNAAITLANLHKASFGFQISVDMEPRDLWGKWIKCYTKKINDMESFKAEILSKSNKTEFDKLYLKYVDREIKRGESSIDFLKKTNYIEKMESEKKNYSFCHHDYANHNVLVGKDEKVTIIDFDYTVLDTHLHDLSSLLIRRMKYGRWSVENANEVLEAYRQVTEVDKDDVDIITGFIEFPQDFWQRGIQYYVEKQPWGEEFFITKLNNFLNDVEDKEEFIKEFRRVNSVKG